MRAAQDEQIRLKDIEVNELKSVRMDLERDLRDTRTVAERVCLFLWFGSLIYVVKLMGTHTVICNAHVPTPQTFSFLSLRYRMFINIPMYSDSYCIVCNILVV